MMKIKKEDRVLLTVVAIFVISFVTKFMVDMLMISDFGYYDRQAQSILQTGYMMNNFSDLPIAHYLMAFLYIITPFTPEITVHFANTLVNSLTVFVIYYIAKEYTDSGTAIILSTIVYAFNPYSFLIVRYCLWKNILVIFLFPTMVYYLIRDSRSWKPAFIFLLMALTHSFGLGIAGLYAIGFYVHRFIINEKYVRLGGFTAMIFLAYGLMVKFVTFPDWSNPFWTYRQFSILVLEAQFNRLRFTETFQQSLLFFLLWLAVTGLFRYKDKWLNALASTAIGLFLLTWIAPFGMDLTLLYLLPPIVAPLVPKYIEHASREEAFMVTAMYTGAYISHFLPALLPILVQ